MKYEAGDKLGALKLFEDVMLENPTVKQKQAALYGSTAVHSAFGDVELAQMTLREAIREGLDFDQALEDPELVEIQTSQQILIQLKRFNQQAIKAQQVTAARSQWSKAQAAARPTSSKASELDLQAVLGTPQKDGLEIDASPAAIAKRVALLLVVGVLLGTALFFLGLETMFPRYE